LVANSFDLLAGPFKISPPRILLLPASFFVFLVAIGLSTSARFLLLFTNRQFRQKFAPASDQSPSQLESLAFGFGSHYKGKKLDLLFLLKELRGWRGIDTIQ
jgi:hypothetical protein